MEVTIKSILMENFKGCRKNQPYEFGSKTRISGANASGKTTIFDSFTWLLFGKDSQGNEKFSIRPLDDNGRQIDNLEIKVSAVLEVDGRKVELTKTQKQNWVKKRGTSEAVMQGNVNSFDIDGYPKAEKDYKAYISEIVREDLFKMLTSPTYFTSLKWKEQRDILMRFVSDISDYDMAKDKPEFSELLDELRKAPSTDDIQKKYQKALTEWKKKQAELPVRIDEVEKQKVDIDVAELELQKKAVAEQIAVNKEKQADVSKQFEEYQKLSDGILELQFQLSDLRRKANEENAKKKRDIDRGITMAQECVDDLEQKNKKDERYIYASSHNCETFKNQIEGYREEWKRVNALEFDENNLICSYCGQEYSAEKKERLRAEFEQKKADDLARITKDGNDLNRTVKVQEEERGECQKRIDERNQKIAEHKTYIAEKENERASLPDSIDISDTDEYKSIKEQIAEKEKAMNKMNGSSEVRDDLRFELNDLQNHLVAIEKKLALSQRNVEIDERISELQAEQREVAQKVADQEKMIYLLEQFIRYKMDSISASINSKFDGICFKLFDLQINGGLKETCECTVNSVPFGSLNNGHKIIAGLKIIKALQELYGVYAPVFVDNSEAISKGNLPEMDCQMILLAVSDDKELKVGVVQ